MTPPITGPAIQALLLWVEACERIQLVPILQYRVRLNSYLPVVEVLLGRDVSDGKLSEVKAEVGGARLIGVSRTWLICSWSI